ncbi:methyltransferase family protein [Xanthomonas vesicatoria]|uniref:Isoprenylcysteine carboxylmethyltransferase family protein n=1 Tax=Xanthomonas vesicatoria TaxID=56460 RepID=A0AAJ0N4F3_9XANT|nr:isoprenylcysteine carboxylmethyltransferase family protein [Xanthomonas vesicatoria]APO94927.1 protein-S-isoprenylcysteine methyltransferase [Xanthomonas vesicatoria]KHM93627.1 protein-S-isoprenylcysteine methyltransferase [Xanthomonas vesicatoria]KHM94727.1 protein-S-isoprenylcysteine methyltransferase [Xanthomonas vesicatoria]MCC8619159.1 isoprenylcysteine carboxylmethyltransferase family protein [Xanthomonas vesicatoria]MCC8621440.1 isoprenylcysteine carboxylmethyltransferase family prot
MSNRPYGHSATRGGRAPWLVKMTSPAHFVLALGAGAWLQQAFALPLPAPTPLAWIELAGGVIACAGLALAVSCFILFARRRTTIMPSGNPSRLVLDGPYRFTRNPMYLALVLSYVGLCLQLGLLWAVALVPLPWLALQWLVIPFEEARLRAEFGRAYSDYCTRVRRWL